MVFPPTPPLISLCNELYTDELVDGSDGSENGVPAEFAALSMNKQTKHEAEVKGLRGTIWVWGVQRISLHLALALSLCVFLFFSCLVILSVLVDLQPPGGQVRQKHNVP